MFSWLGGGDSSKSTTTDKKVVINKDSLNLLNKQLTETVANSIIKNASTCKSDAAAGQSITMRNIDAAGDIDFTLAQKSTTTLNFSCVQASETRVDAANSMATQLMDSLKNNMSADMLGKLEQIASQKKSDELGSFGGGDSAASSDVNINYQSTNETNKNLQNVIQNSITNNFTSEDVKGCISTVTGSQNAFFDGIHAGGNIKANFAQDMVLSTLSECKQLQDSSNKVTNAIVNTLGLEVSDSKSTTVQTDTSNTSLSEHKSTGLAGLAEGIGNGIGSAAEGIGSGIGNAFSGMFSGLLMPFIFCCVCLCICMCCCVVIVAIGGFVASKNPESTEKLIDIGKSAMSNTKFGKKMPSAAE